MADDQVQLPATPDGPSRGRGTATHSGGQPEGVQPPADATLVGTLLSPFESTIRWFAGALIILAVQLSVYAGLWAIEFYIFAPTDPVAFGFFVILNIAIAVVIFSEVLERGFWLSRLLRLPIRPGTRPIARSIIWAIAGPLALFVYTQQVSKPRIEAGKSGSEVAPEPADSTREIVETVVFVVVLVLLLKSFAAEAFVIPTGSMAETLWGYQKVVECPECKYQFPVNASQEADAQDRDRDRLVPVIGGVCPNCGKPILFNGYDQDRRSALAVTRFKEKYNDVVEIADPGWTSGDRVLVAKFLYELLGTYPNRLDVVVFKFPGDSGSGDGMWPQSGPQKNHVPINYIKRLVGLPGEIIAIKGGKLYVLSADKVPAALRQQFDDLAGLSGADREEMRLQLWRREHMHVDKAPFDAGKYLIVKKPADTILSMHRIVCDNDHQAGDLRKSKHKQRWWSTDEWTAGGENGFDHKGDTRGVHMLRYRHVLRGDNNEPQLIADAMGYNNNWPAQNGDSPLGRWSGDNWVGDLILECDLVVEKAEGEFVLELSRSADRFQAVWELSNGRCSLWRIHNGTKDDAPLASVDTKVKKGTYHLRFANVDRRLTVWVDNRVVEWSGGAQGVDYETPDRDADLPTKNDLEPASIGASGAAVRVQKIKLWRDTYYTVDASKPDLHVNDADWSRPEDWKQKSLPFKTLYVQPGHFLCMGDNSPQSSDGRNWGLVPERLLLGRAQLVYYPFYFPWWPLNSQVNRLQVIR